MLILIHVLIAIGSLLYTTYAYIAPSLTKVRISYALVAGTLISGTYLVISNPTHIFKTCMVGLVYVGVVLVGIVATKNKLAHAAVN